MRETEEKIRRVQEQTEKLRQETMGNQDVDEDDEEEDFEDEAPEEDESEESVDWDKLRA